jgi:hypothetical protein
VIRNNGVVSDFIDPNGGMSIDEYRSRVGEITQTHAGEIRGDAELVGRGALATAKMANDLAVVAGAGKLALGAGG